MSTYTTYYQGVQVTSNIPTDIAQAGNFTYTVYWSDNALGWIEDKVAEGFSALNNYTGNIIAKFIAEMAKQDPQAQLSNVKFTATNEYAQISFTTQTLSIFTTVGIIVGIIVWALAIATAVIPGVDVLSIGGALIYTFLDAIGVATLNWFVKGVDAIYQPLAQTVGPAAASGITILIVGGIIVVLGVIGYYAYEKVGKVV